MRPSDSNQNINRILGYFENVEEYKSASDILKTNIRFHTLFTLEDVNRFFSSSTNVDASVKNALMESYYETLSENYDNYSNADKQTLYPITKEQHINAIIELIEDKDFKSFLSNKIKDQTPPAAPTVQSTQAVSPTRSSFSASQDTANAEELIAKIKELQERAETLGARLDSLKKGMSKSDNVSPDHASKIKSSSPKIKSSRGLGG